MSHRFEVGLLSRRRLLAFAGAGTLAALLGLPHTAIAAETVDPAHGVYLAAADKICKTSNDKLVEAAKDYEKHLIVIRRGAKSIRHKVAKPIEVAAFINKVALAELNSQFDQLDRLVAPASDKVSVTGFLKDGRAAIATLKVKPSDATYDDPFNKLGKQMKSFGYKDCGQALRSKNL